MKEVISGKPEDNQKIDLQEVKSFSKLENFVEISSSKRIYVSEYTKNGIPFYRGQEISNINNLNPNDLVYISKERYLEIKNKFGTPKVGDLLITAVGTIGNTWIVDERDFYFKDGNILWIRPKVNNINMKYIELLIKINKNKIIDNSSGSSQNAITTSVLKNLKVYIPPLEEQNKIVHFLSLIDDLIKSTSLQVLLSKKLRKSYLEKIFYSNQYNEYLIGTKKLGELFIIESIGIDKKINEGEDQVKMINYLDVYRGIVNEENLLYTSANAEKISKTLVQKDDILITPTSETPTDIFNSFVVREKFYTDVVYSYHLTKLSPVGKTNSNFSKIYFDTAPFRREVSKYATGSTRFTLSKNDISNLIVPIYNDTFQNEIVSFFDKYDDIEKNTLKILDQYKQLKKYYLNIIFK